MWSDPNLLFWALPEEKSAGDSTITAEASYIHSNDPRPVFEYLSSGHDASSMQGYISYLDIIGEGAYPIDDGWHGTCTGSSFPPVFDRWVVEQEILAIKNAGFTTATKTPILVPETIPPGAYCSGAPGTTAGDITNQIWNGLAAGAHGYLNYIWSEGALPDGNGVPEAMATVNSLLVGQEGIGEWLTKGVHQSDLSTTVTSGPGTVSFNGPDGNVTYGSIRAAVWDWAGVQVIVAINSSTSPITANISALPAGVPAASVVNEGRSITITAGSFLDSFTGLQVHIYKIPLVSLQSGSWIVLP
jgi:hypothetical protein